MFNNIETEAPSTEELWEQVKEAESLYKLVTRAERLPPSERRDNIIALATSKLDARTTYKVISAENLDKATEMYAELLQFHSKYNTLVSMLEHLGIDVEEQYNASFGALEPPPAVTETVESSMVDKLLSLFRT